MPEPTLSEIEQINAAQRELDVRKATVMIDKIAAVESAIASTGGKAFIAALRNAVDGMVDGTSRNAVQTILSSINSVVMSMQFDKNTYESILAPAVEPLTPPAA